MSQIRQAILQYAMVGRPVGRQRLAAGIAAMKQAGIELGILAPTDLPEVPMNAAGFNADRQQPASWQVSTPEVDWVPPWEPRYENFDVFLQWRRNSNWRDLSEQEASRLFRQRMCELELIPPAFCHPPAQPNEPEGPTPPSDSQE